MSHLKVQVVIPANAFRRFVFRIPAETPTNTTEAFYWSSSFLQATAWIIP